MSWWFSDWWNKKKDEPPQPIGKVIDETMDNIDNLSAKRMQLLKKSNDAFKEAQKCQKTDRPRAIALLKQKQEWDRQAAVYEGMIANVEKTSMALDSAATSVQIAKSMQSGTHSIKQMMREVKVSDVEAIADDMDDTLHEVRALTDALSKPMGNGINDEELMEELINGQLDEWNAETVMNELPEVKVGTGVNVNQVPLKIKE